MIGKRRAFTLVELLVVIAIIAIMVGLLLPAIQAARGSARKAQCASRMRQVGIGMLQYIDAHKGRFPLLAYHNTVSTGDKSEEEKSWIATLAPYIENVSAVRVCPDDVEREEEVEPTATSFAMNGYLRRPQYIDTSNLPPEVAEQILKGNEGLVGKYSDLAETHNTIMLFEGMVAKLKLHYDHVHSYAWFTDRNIAYKTVYLEVSYEVSVDRHHGSTANYLYCDGHVEAIGSDQIKQWCDEGHNFAKPVTR